MVCRNDYDIPTSRERGRGREGRERERGREGGRKREREGERGREREREGEIFKVSSTQRTHHNKPSNLSLVETINFLSRESLPLFRFPTLSLWVGSSPPSDLLLLMDPKKDVQVASLRGLDPARRIREQPSIVQRR